MGGMRFEFSVSGEGLRGGQGEPYHWVSVVS